MADYPRAEIEIAVEGAMGIISLDRPQAINALNGAMIEAIRTALAGWRNTDKVRCVLIEGRGEKGFCAGGDVRAVRSAVLEGEIEAAHGFFAAEYEMNGLIATYPKPIVAFQHGIVMGGGIGLSSHARYRIATPASRFAMPEAAIGFFCDVGVNAILARAPEPRALAFLLSGQSIEAADAIGLGLSDTMVPHDYLPRLRSRLIDCARAGEVDTAIVSTLQGESVEPGPATFLDFADTLAPVFSAPDIARLTAELETLADDGDPAAAAMVHKFASACPTSLAVILASHRRARRQRSIKAVLALDLALARAMCLRADFAEGVRALLIDKDRKPVWSPASHEAVDLGFAGDALA